MKLSEKLDYYINELNPQLIKAGAKTAGRVLKSAGKTIRKVGSSALKRNAGTAEAAVVAGITAPVGQKIYDRIEKKSRLNKKKKEQLEKTVHNQIANRDTFNKELQEKLQTRINNLKGN